MLPDILLETLSFLNRSSLEACELVSRSYLRTVTESNSALALRPMYKLFVNCNDLHMVYCDGIVEFLRPPSDEHAGKVVELAIGVGMSWRELQAIAEETVARTRNMYIDCLCIQCATCASPLFALWRDTFNDHKPCKAVKLHMSLQCWPDNDTDFRQLIQPFVASKLGVVSYDITAYGWHDFTALWPAWNRSNAEFFKLHARGGNVLSNFIGQLLREPKHGVRHYTVVEEHSTAESLYTLEDYVQKFEFGGSECNYPVSLALHRSEREDRTIHRLRRVPLRTLDKPPKRSVPDPDGNLVEESSCDVYEIRNEIRRLTVHGYFWVATIRSHHVTRVTEHYIHCYWFYVVPF